MKTGLRHIIGLLCLIFATLRLHGQAIPDPAFILNQYELKCAECVDLRTRVNSGEKVSRQQAKALLDEFVDMNKDVRALQDSLTAYQQTRFEAINIWFATGQRPMMMNHRNLTALKAISPSAETMEETLVAWPEPQPYHPDISIGQVPSGPKYTVMASASVPDLSFGAMIGIQARSEAKNKATWGGYVNLKSNFRFTESSYFCSADGKMENGGAFWPSGNKRKSTFKMTGGMLAGVNRWLSLYAGLGYGSSRLLWEDVDGQWALVQDVSHAGLASEAGLIFSLHRLSIGAGISTIRFRTASIDLSVGISF